MGQFFSGKEVGLAGIVFETSAVILPVFLLPSLQNPPEGQRLFVDGVFFSFEIFVF